MEEEGRGGADKGRRGARGERERDGTIKPREYTVYRRETSTVIEE